MAYCTATEARMANMKRVEVRLAEADSQRMEQVSRRGLWHYTTVAGIAGILRSKQLWASKIQYLNDGKEFLHAFELRESDGCGVGHRT